MQTRTARYFSGKKSLILCNFLPLSKSGRNPCISCVSNKDLKKHISQKRKRRQKLADIQHLVFPVVCVF